MISHIISGVKSLEVQEQTNQTRVIRLMLMWAWIKIWIESHELLNTIDDKLLNILESKIDVLKEELKTNYELELNKLKETANSQKQDIKY